MTDMTFWPEAKVESFLADAPKYRSIREVKAYRLDSPLVWSTSTGSEMSAAAGDWMVTDGQKSWTVDHQIFEATYRSMSPGVFRKFGIVQARQIEVSAIIPTLEGNVCAEPGDWVVRGEAGDVWPVPDLEFTRAYERLANP